MMLCEGPPSKITLTEINHGILSIFAYSIYLETHTSLKRLEKNDSEHFREMSINVDVSLEYKSIENFTSNECDVTSPHARARLQLDYRNYYQNFRYDQSWTLKTKSGQVVKTSKRFIESKCPRWYEQLTNILGPKDYVDFDFEVVSQALHFLYHGEAPKMEKMAKELFLISKKFDFEDLNRLSEEEICNSLRLDIDDMIKNLIFAEEKRVISVKFRIINYIASQPAYLFDIPQFLQLEKSHPYLMQDILNVRMKMGVT
ncbi:hypothetical protein QAD02_010121 [Eretmocerus hayati]|uniref:Uncharacterized protein n=1 Tax=Eretmocerus hayati TaxID=131215 RepID=A0ACC2NBW9_9HYME|nr:hypothetical protein QAD02_010121 [Eretmocerus hayati]